MKNLLRSFLINLAALLTTAQLLPGGLYYSGGVKSLILATIGFMLMNALVVPILKVIFLPLNLLTLGLFAWIVNVVALYLLTRFLPDFGLRPFDFAGANIKGIIFPAFELTLLQVAVVASFIIGFITHFLKWLCESQR